MPRNAGHFALAVKNVDNKLKTLHSINGLQR